MNSLLNKLGRLGFSRNQAMVQKEGEKLNIPKFTETYIPKVESPALCTLFSALRPRAGDQTELVVEAAAYFVIALLVGRTIGRYPYFHYKPFYNPRCQFPSTGGVFWRKMRR